MLHSRWRYEAAVTVRHVLTPASTRFERPPSGRTTLKVIILLLGIAAASRAAFAATIIVNTGTDESTPSDGYCSLREAINNANNPGTDTTGGDCNVGSGNDKIAILVLSGQIALADTLPAILNTLTIVGPGQTVPIVANGFLIFHIASGATATLNSVALEGGNAFEGGAALNEGTLTVVNCTFTNNTSSANGPGGGAIANEVGSLYISGSSFENNRTQASDIGDNYGQGGAIFNNSGVVSVSNSTFVANQAGYGGAIFNGKNQLFVISNSTFFADSAQWGGDDLFNLCGVNNNGSVLNVDGSILVPNDFLGPGSCGLREFVTSCGGFQCLCDQGVSDLGYNIAIDHSCGFANTNGGGANGQTLGDGVDPMLDPNGLRNNGGPTDTIALQSDSPAIDAIPTTSNQCPATDQRGFSRPDSEGPGFFISACDVGALESSPTPTPTPTSTPKPTASRTTIQTPTKTPARTPTKTPTRTPAKTPTRTSTKTPARTPTRTTTRTPIPSHTPARTPSHTPTRTPTRTITRTPTPSHTPARTPSHTPTRTPTRTTTRTPTLTRTPSRTPTAKRPP